MTEAEIRQAAQMYALVAEMEAVKALIDGMKAENEWRKFNGFKPAHDEKGFRIAGDALSKIAKRLRDEI